MRYVVYITEGINLDSIVVRLEGEGHEVLFVNRFLDYLIVESQDESKLWVSGVADVVEDIPL